MIHNSETLQAAFHYLFPNEVPELKRLAQMLPDNPVVLNIGAGAGTSGLIFMESRADLYLDTVDIQKDSSPFGCLDAEWDILDEAGYTSQGRNKQFHMPSVELLQATIDEFFLYDMIFIDGDHDYEACKVDIELSLQCIKPGGILAIHDYDKENISRAYDPENFPDKWPKEYPHWRAWPGVDRAVNDVLKGKYEMIGLVDSLISFRIDKITVDYPEPSELDKLNFNASQDIKDKFGYNFDGKW